jgi:hypothetical protein
MVRLRLLLQPLQSTLTNLRRVPLLLPLLLWQPAASGQERPDPQLLTLISRIRAVDNHSHGLPATTGSAVSEPEDPLGTSAPFFAVRQRETNPEWIEAWRALYGYRHADIALEHVREAFRTKRSRMKEKGTGYPEWVLDQVGIEFALINAAELGAGQTSPRFRWVPYADGFSWSRS